MNVGTSDNLPHLLEVLSASKNVYDNRDGHIARRVQSLIKKADPDSQAARAVIECAQALTAACDKIEATDVVAIDYFAKKDRLIIELAMFLKPE